MTVDGEDAILYVRELFARVREEPGWDFYGEDLPDWCRRALSAVALLSGGEQPVYVSGKYNDETRAGTLHLFFKSSVFTIEAHRNAGDIENATVTERPRAHLQALEVHVTEAATSDLLRQASWPGNVWATARYRDDRAIELPVSPVNDTRLSTRLMEFLPSLRADLGVAAERS